MAEAEDSDFDNDEEEERIYYAVDSGDECILKHLLDDGYNPNFKFEGSNQLNKSVLHLACEKGHIQCAKLLLERKANINAEDAWFQTPLMYSICTERDNMVKLLVQHGVGLNKRDRFGRSALHYAMMNETMDCIKQLVEAGAEVNIVESVGKTPLYDVVCKDGNIELVKYLISHGSSVNAKDMREKRAMLAACILHSKADKVAYVKILLEAGANPNAIDSHAYTPFTIFIKYHFKHGQNISDEDLQIANLLLSYGYKVNLHCEVKYLFQFHGTPLKMAADRGCPALVELLLQNGANPDIGDMKKICPIHAAVFKGNIQCVKLLIQYNASLNCMAEMKFARDDERTVTPFHCALICNHTAIAKLLYQAGSSMWLEELWDAENVLPCLIDTEFSDWLQEQLSTPRTLFTLIRLDIRVRLLQPFWKKIDWLPLPRQLKLALGMPELNID